jgi:peptidyl-prolyl cis-trans isomerase B (cyclophilin B)
MPPSHRLLGVLVCATGATLIGLAGCSKTEPEAKSPPVAVTEPEPKKTAPDRTVVAQPVSRHKLQKSFKEAVILDPPTGQQCPPARTFAGKNVAQIFEAVSGKNFAGGLWDQVEFFDAQGRRLRYTAVLKTDLGEIEMELLSEAAPHHVTNFIALARAGYYDGLPFHAVGQRSRKVETEKDVIGYLEAGCPLGKGTQGYGSVGYWLEPETDNQFVHEAGSVGAFHEPDQTDTAAGRFYLTLQPMPGMDRAYTIFGKVTHGLDVARTINLRPVVDEDPYDRPQEPVVIRTVTIYSAPVQ